jgi:hypothetical protein
MRLIINGPIPSKKNAYAQTRAGRRFRPKELVRQINWIIWQIKAGTGNIAQLERPSIKAHFVCTDLKGDLDNKWTTLQDCLVASGLLVNDNLKHLCGPITITGEKGADDCTILEIEPCV